MKDPVLIQEYEKVPKNLSRSPKETIIIVSDPALPTPTGRKWTFTTPIMPFFPGFQPPNTFADGTNFCTMG